MLPQTTYHGWQPINLANPTGLNGLLEPLDCTILLQLARPDQPLVDS